VLDDGETVHNAFFDRNFTRQQELWKFNTFKTQIPCIFW
jgi:hypothetical protein